MLRLINDAQRLGFSLNEIRAGLSEAAPNFPSRVAMVKALRSKLENVDQHIKEVRARRRQIVKLLKEWAIERLDKPPPAGAVGRGLIPRR
jgi:MerR family transcriptional regulator, copper efflux regulator